MRRDREGKIPTTLRVPAELHERLSRLAKEQHRTVNSQILFLVDQALADDKSAQPLRAVAGGKQS